MTQTIIILIASENFRCRTIDNPIIQSLGFYLEAIYKQKIKLNAILEDLGKWGIMLPYLPIPLIP